MKVIVLMPHMLLCVMSYCGMTHWTPKFVNWEVLTLFGLEGGMAPLRAFAKYLKNGLAGLHEIL